MKRKSLFINLLTLIAIIFIGCNKEYIEHPTCQRVYELSDKYNTDTVYMKTDTLWPWGRYNNAFCGADTLQFSTVPLFRHCDPSLPFRYEIIRYVIGNKITQPHIFK